ncbi:MAG: alkaline phosphatase [Flavobacteriales bacterium]|nr:alkaline phosphatase [Flavobacteriales bacterium]|tara:strand:+ start:2179 stop:3861 length:1683 start_codon:yes stop_codon:yes gene_type:complete
MNFQNKKYNRKEFITFLGKVTLGANFIPPFLMSYGNTSKPIKTGDISNKQLKKLKKLSLEGLVASDQDDLLLTKGLDYHVILKWNDKINNEDRFGFNCDYNCFIPIDPKNPNDGLLWVNHEYINPLFVSGFNYRDAKNIKTKKQVDEEMYNVGGSIVRIKKENEKWQVVHNDPHNRRITAKTPMKLNWDQPLKGKTTVIGTLANCSGGITPWNTFLTCEENYDGYYGDNQYDKNNKPTKIPSYYGWDKFYDYPPEHYGWVVEIDPKDGKAQKHIALGRFAHECCTLFQLDDNRIVAYTGDDKNDEHLYKFVSSKPNSLKEGTLYVADMKKGKWLALDWENQSILKSKFKDQTEVLIRVREASKLLGATELNRPEDIEIDPITGNIFVSLTNNKYKGDYHGSILKIEENNGEFDSLNFNSSTYMTGGEKSGFSCPDNLAFDFSGNLWITSDISGYSMNKFDGPYMPFKNNSLFVIPRYGNYAGKVIRVASAPRDAELTGPWFAPDGKSLFLSVQHPGERTTDINNPTSKWPFDQDKIPKPSVVAITGDLIEKMNYLNKIES